MQRFHTGQMINHSLMAIGVAGAVTIFGVITAALTWWLIPLAWIAAVGYVVFRMRRFIRRLRAGDEPSAGVRETLEKEVDFYRALDDTEKARFRRDVHYFLLDHHIEGIDVELDDELLALAAAGAVVLSFGMPDYEWGNTRDILIYPTSYNEDYEYGSQGHVLGQVSQQGSIILSADALRSGFANGTDGHNVALHEYAHVIDFEDGDIDGIPAKLSWTSIKPWMERMHTHLGKVDGGGRRKKVFRNYAYTNEAEFFACATEMFFEQPGRLHHKAPELYELLTEFYGQDPRGGAS